MDKAAIEAMLQAAYGARMRGDVEGVMRHFAQTAQFAVSGSPAASPIPTLASGQAAIREVMTRLVEAFEFADAEIVNIIVEGPDAAVQWRVNVKATLNGAEAVTEIVDIVRVEDGRIVSLKQFADTALVARLLGA